MTVASRIIEKIDTRREQLTALAGACYANSGGVGLTWEQLHVEIEQKEACPRSTARRRFDAMLAARVIRKKGEKYLRE